MQKLRQEEKYVFKKPSRKLGKKTSYKTLLLFEKGVIWGKSKYSTVSFQYVSIVLNLVYDKRKLYKTFDYWSKDVLNFDLLGKVLEIISPSQFANGLSRKMLLILYSINWKLSDCRYFLRYWAICVLE